MDKIYRHILHIKPYSEKPVEFVTQEYLCHNFDSKTAKNFVIQLEGEREKRHLERGDVGKVAASQQGVNNFMFCIFFFDDSDGHKNILRETADKIISQHIEFLRLKVSELEKIKLDF